MVPFEALVALNHGILIHWFVAHTKQRLRVVLWAIVDQVWQSLVFEEHAANIAPAAPLERALDVDLLATSVSPAR
jgi:hypothetical protein